MNTKRRLFLSVATILFSSALAGCVVPNAAIYYRPAVEGGTVTAGRCVPLASRVSFTVGGLPVMVLTSIQKNEVIVFLLLRPGPGQVVRFASDRFRVRDTKNNRDVPVNSIYAMNHESSTTPTTPYPTAPRAPNSRAGLYFDISVRVTDAGMESFTFSSPSIVINGKEVPFPDIRFERKFWMGISPFNC